MNSLRKTNDQFRLD